ncbi:unnamed protein product, partial [Allacma fusca]
SLKYGTRSQRI